MKKITDKKAKKLYKNLLLVHGHYDTIEVNHLNGLFHEKLEERGMNVDENTANYEIVSEYLTGGYKDMESDEKSAVDNEFVDEVLDNLEKINKYADMIKGYQEMANINLTISHEDHHLESEGASLSYEVDTTKSKGEAK